MIRTAEFPFPKILHAMHDLADVYNVQQTLHTKWTTRFRCWCVPVSTLLDVTRTRWTPSNQASDDLDSISMLFFTFDGLFKWIPDPFNFMYQKRKKKFRPWMSSAYSIRSQNSLQRNHVHTLTKIVCCFDKFFTILLRVGCMCVRWRNNESCVCVLRVYSTAKMSMQAKLQQCEMRRLNDFDSW